MTNPLCNHVKDIVPWPAGSWIKETVGKRVRIVCKECGKLYGYLADKPEGKT